MKNRLDVNRIFINVTIFLIIVAFGIWFKYLYYMFDSFYIIGKAVYLYLNILPNLFKIPMMFAFTRMAVSIACDMNFVSRCNFIEYFVIYIVFPFLIINVWIAFFKL